jgi:hypothetical protein
MISFSKMARLIVPLLLFAVALVACRSEPAPPVQVVGEVAFRGVGTNTYDRYLEGLTVQVLNAKGERLGEAQTDRAGQYRVPV